ncbi:MAG: flagellar basal body P-ring formation chaperone FlgA [Pseudomonadota bacterium]
MKNLRVMLCFVLLLGLPAHAKELQSPRELQSHSEIRQAVIAFVRAGTETLPGQVTFKVDQIDPRVVLAVCHTVEIFVPPGTQLLGNTMVGARCPGKNGWSLFIPVHIKVTVDLLLANKPLLQGHVLQSDDISSQPGEMTQPGLITDPMQAVGKVLKMGISSGQPLKRDMLRAPYVITQGQTVQILADGAGYRISFTGVALGNAAESQGVQVKTPSGQVVNGTARAGGVVVVQP